MVAKQSSSPSVPRGDAAYQTLFVTQTVRVAGSSGFAAVLVLYLARASTDQPAGLGLSVGQASAWFALYLGLSFAAAAPAAWIARTVTGPLVAYAVGCALTAVGLVLAAIDPHDLVWASLVLAAAGGGVLRPALVLLVPTTRTGSGTGRHAALTRMQVAVAIGGIVGPLAAGVADQALGAQAAFLVCSALASLAFLVLVLRRTTLTALRTSPSPDRSQSRIAWSCLVGVVIVAVVAVPAGRLEASAASVLLVLALAVVVTQLVLLGFPAAGAPGGRTLIGFDGLVMLSVAFWTGASLSGSTVSLLVDRGVDRDLGPVVVPTEWFQMITAIVTIAAVPVLNRALTRTTAGPLRSVRLVAGGVATSAAAFLVLLPVAHRTDEGVPSSMVLPVLALALVGLATLLVNPTGQSVAARPGDDARASRWVGLWYTATGVGVLVGGLLAERAGELGFAGLITIVVCVQGVVATAGLVLARRVAARLTKPDDAFVVASASA